MSLPSNMKRSELESLADLMVRICWATTDRTSMSMRLNSSKQHQLPDWASPAKNFPSICGSSLIHIIPGIRQQFCIHPCTWVSVANHWLTYLSVKDPSPVQQFDLLPWNFRDWIVGSYLLSISSFRFLPLVAMCFHCHSALMPHHLHIFH